jgi:hypothetical protein
VSIDDSVRPDLIRDLGGIPARRGVPTKEGPMSTDPQTAPSEIPRWARAENFVFVPIEKATTPIPGTPTVYRDYYWLVDDQDQIAFYNPLRAGRRTRPGYGDAQGNPDERVGVILAPRYPWCVGNRKIPLVFEPQTGEG